MTKKNMGCIYEIYFQKSPPKLWGGKIQFFDQNISSFYPPFFGYGGVITHIFPKKLPPLIMGDPHNFLIVFLWSDPPGPPYT